MKHEQLYHQNLVKDWPNGAQSQFVQIGHVHWHYQRMGPIGGTKLLLIHGTGASTHSYRDLMPLLAQAYDVLAIDLPGHGFTRVTRSQYLSLPGMVEAIGALLQELNFPADYVVGHSAGAAILIEMCLRDVIAPKQLIGLNSAIRPIQGNALFSPLAKLLFVNPFVPRLFNLQAKYGAATSQLLKATGSEIDAEGIRCYQQLLEDKDHVSGALGMMASWDLGHFREQFAELDVPTTLISSEDDRMVPPSASKDAVLKIPDAKYLSVPTGGHLLHEVAPEKVAEMIRTEFGGA